MGDLERYTRYYHDQVGSGLNVFRGSRYQRGHGGIGKFFRGLLRFAMPLFKSGAKAVGQEALRAGTNILSDMSSAKPVKEVFKDRLREAGHALHARAAAGVNRMSGGGGGGGGRIKGVKRRCNVQSGGKAKRTRTSSKQKSTRKITKKRKNRKNRKNNKNNKTKKSKKPRKGKKKKNGVRSVRTVRDIFG
jgi:hypothetical protein